MLLHLTIHRNSRRRSGYLSASIGSPYRVNVLRNRAAPHSVNSFKKPGESTKREIRGMTTASKSEPTSTIVALASLGCRAPTNIRNRVGLPSRPSIHAMVRARDESSMLTQIVPSEYASAKMILRGGFNLDELRVTSQTVSAECSRFRVSCGLARGTGSIQSLRRWSTKTYRPECQASASKARPQVLSFADRTQHVALSSLED